MLEAEERKQICFLVDKQMFTNKLNEPSNYLSNLLDSFEEDHQKVLQGLNNNNQTVSKMIDLIQQSAHHNEILRNKVKMLVERLKFYNEKDDLVLNQEKVLSQQPNYQILERQRNINEQILLERDTQMRNETNIQQFINKQMIRIQNKQRQIIPPKNSRIIQKSRIIISEQSQYRNIKKFVKSFASHLEQDTKSSISKKMVLFSFLTWNNNHNRKSEMKDSIIQSQITEFMKQIFPNKHFCKKKFNGLNFKRGKFNFLTQNNMVAKLQDQDQKKQKRSLLDISMIKDYKSQIDLQLFNQFDQKNVLQLDDFEAKCLRDELLFEQDETSSNKQKMKFVDESNEMIQ